MITSFIIHDKAHLTPWFPR